MSLISVRGLSHRFANGTEGLRDVDLEIRSREFLIIAGRNGSGKTLLMLHIVGLLVPTTGTVEYRGRPIEKRIDEVRNRIGIVFQDPEAQFLGQTVREDVGFGLEYSSLPAEEIRSRVDRSLELMSVHDLANRRPMFLSGGEKRKVALAGLLARDPEVLFLDEPFIGLDYPGVRSVLSSLVELHAAGHTVVVITHDVEKVAAHSSRMVVMDAGTVAEDGAPKTILPRLPEYEVRRPAGPLESMSWLPR